MFRLSSNALNLALLGTGAAVWFAASRPLAEDESLRMPSNPFGIKRSPYGEVFAMAMQGPIDTWFHGGEECHDANCTNPAHHHHHEETAAHHDEQVAENDHDHDHEIEHPRSLDERYVHYLDELNEIAEQRTNPIPPPAGLLFARRRTIEDKLRFAYELDPSHYGNYITYHFFLTQPQLGTHPELTPGAAKLARETIAYCLNRDDDPRPALTAAAAAQHILELMFEKPYLHPSPEMRGMLAVEDQSLARHQQLVNRWIQSGEWNNLSSDRQKEISDRVRFLVRVRDADEATILRLEGKARPQASN